MAKRHDKTRMGGTKNTFQTTLWFWKPVYCYLRRKGYDDEPAKDLTQGFFHEIVLGRNLIQQADQTRGRFRTFLLTTLDRYVTNVYRRETAQKRKSMDPMVRLEPTNLPSLPAKQSEAEPEQVFHYAWASNLLDEVLAEVKDGYYSTGKSAHWEVFSAKVIEPIFENTKPSSLARICAKYEIETESKASNMIVTVKRRFRTALKRHMRQFVQSDLEVEEEFRDLLRILSRQ
jgi:RNA polymerase sigma-70 factor (ECF subfamily)